MGTRSVSSTEESRTRPGQAGTDAYERTAGFGEGALTELRDDGAADVRRGELLRELRKYFERANARRSPSRGESDETDGGTEQIR